MVEQKAQSSEGDLGSVSVVAIYCLSSHYEPLKGGGWVPINQHSACGMFAHLNQQYSLTTLLFFSSRLCLEADGLGKDADFNAGCRLALPFTVCKTKEKLPRSRLHHTPIRSVLPG